MKKKCIGLFAIVLLIAYILAGCTGNYMSSSWSKTGESHSLSDRSWEITAKSANGHVSRNVVFTSSTLESLYVKSTNSEGNIIVIFTQGEISKTYNVSGTFEGSLDLSVFAEDKISIRVNFENAKDVYLNFSW